jgi:hypothetical protein
MLFESCSGVFKEQGRKVYVREQMVRSLVPLMYCVVVVGITAQSQYCKVEKQSPKTGKMRCLMSLFFALQLPMLRYNLIFLCLGGRKQVCA